MVQGVMHRMEYEFKGFDGLRPALRSVQIVGIVLIALGIIALGTTFLSTLASVVVLGAMLFVAGIVQAVNAFSARKWSGFFLQLLSCIFYLLAGAMMVTRPVTSAVELTLFLAILFMVTGVFRIVSSLMVRFPQWGWTCFSGVVAIVLAAMVFSNLPVAATWLIGTLVGVELVFNGISLVALSSHVRDAVTQPI